MATITGLDGQKEDMGRAELEFTCACGQQVVVFEKGILHSFPMCADFREREPIDYLAWFRKRAESFKQDPS